jgi:hypothetical protein
METGPRAQSTQRTQSDRPAQYCHAHRIHHQLAQGSISQAACFLDEQPPQLGPGVLRSCPPPAPGPPPHRRCPLSHATHRHHRRDPGQGPESPAPRISGGTKWMDLRAYQGSYQQQQGRTWEGAPSHLSHGRGELHYVPRLFDSHLLLPSLPGTSALSPTARSGTGLLRCVPLQPVLMQGEACSGRHWHQGGQPSGWPRPPSRHRCRPRLHYCAN